MVAQRDAPMVRQGNNTGQVPDGCHDRCIELRLGRMVETIRPLQQTQGRGLRLLAIIGGGHEQQCLGAFWCQADGQGPPRTLPQPSGAGQDQQQGNTSTHQPFEGPLHLPEQHRPWPLVHVLLSTHPTCRSPQVRQGQCASRSSERLEAYALTSVSSRRSSRSLQILATAMRYRYFGTKELRSAPVFTWQGGISRTECLQVCPVLAMQAYLGRTSSELYTHSDLVYLFQHV